jgi:hypothetical protein
LHAWASRRGCDLGRWLLAVVADRFFVDDIRNLGSAPVEIEILAYRLGRALPATERIIIEIVIRLF